MHGQDSRHNFGQPSWTDLEMGNSKELILGQAAGSKGVYINDPKVTGGVHKWRHLYGIWSVVNKQTWNQNYHLDDLGISLGQY